MRRSTAVLSVSLAFLFVAGCQSQKQTTEVAESESAISSTPLFQTKEPERYRATRTITIFSTNGESLITKTLTARNGESRFVESETNGKRSVYLTIPEGSFTLWPDEKIYVDLTNGPGFATAENEEQPDVSYEHYLHGDANTTSTYQKLGTEVIDGRNSTKYRVVVNSSSGASVKQTETMIWIDEALSIPIKSETKSPDGTRITTTLTDISLDVDGRIFQVPNGYERVTFAEYRERLRKSAVNTGK